MLKNCILFGVRQWLFPLIALFACVSMPLKADEDFLAQSARSVQGTTHLNPVITVGIPKVDVSQAYHRAGEDVDQLRAFMKSYWQMWGQEFGYDIEFRYASYQSLYSDLLEGHVDVLTTSTYNTNLTKWVKFSLPYIQVQTALWKRVGEQREQGKVGFVLPSSIKPTDFNVGYGVEIHTNSTEKVVERAEALNYIYSWVPKEVDVALQDRGLSDQFSRIDTNNRISIRSMTRFEDSELMLLVNQGIRNLSEELTHEMWFQITGNGNESFDILVGSYIKDINESQERKLVERPVLEYAYIVDGEEPYFIAEEFFIEGYIVDVMRSISQSLGITFVAKPYHSFQEAMDAVRNREVDMFPGVYKTDQRSASLDFTMDIDRTHLAIASEEDYYAISQLKGKRLALVRGLHENELLAELLPVNPIIYLDTAEEAMRAVAEGRADAYVGKLLNSAYLVNKHKLFTLNLHKAEDFDTEFWPRIALPKMESEWVSLLNMGIYSLGEGFQQNLQKKWKEHIVFSQESERVKALYQQVVIASGVLIVFLLMCFMFYRHQLSRRKEIQATLEQALKDAEQAKREAEELTLAKSDFLARMSHEIRTPMNGVLGMAEALSFTKLDKEQEDLLYTLNGSARNLMALLNDVLDFSKMDAGKLTLESVNCEVNSLMTSVVGNFKHKATAKDLSINSRVDAQIGGAYQCDSTRLMQVLNNLVSNSVKFTQHGFVELSAQLIAADYKQDDNGASYDLIGFQVRDSGIGIAKEKLDTLFDPFVQADGDITRRFGGTGLGLSICNEIVSEMGGEIRVSSVIGHGSLFSITLPLQVDRSVEVVEQGVSFSDLPTGNQLEQIRVLFAEDNEVNRKVIGGQLKRLGVNFDTAENGLIAYNKFLDDPSYDVVLSDCHMPEMDGFTLATKISTEFSDNKPHLIAITADALSGAAKRCMAAGFDDYISKPCPLDVLESKLIQVTSKQPLAESDFSDVDNSLVAWLDANSFEPDNQHDEQSIVDAFHNEDMASDHSSSASEDPLIESDFSWIDDLEASSNQDSESLESELDTICAISAQPDFSLNAVEAESESLPWREIEAAIHDIESDSPRFGLKSQGEEAQEDQAKSSGVFKDVGSDESEQSEFQSMLNEFNGSNDQAEVENSSAELSEIERFEREMEQFELAVQKTQIDSGEFNASDFEQFGILPEQSQNVETFWDEPLFDQTNDNVPFDSGDAATNITSNIDPFSGENNAQQSGLEFDDEDFLNKLGLASSEASGIQEISGTPEELTLPDYQAFDVSHVLAMSGDDHEIANDILTTFIKNYRNDIAELESAGAIQDGSFIKDTAHRIKGSALYLGNDPLSGVAKELEKSSARGDLTYSDERIAFITKGLALLGQEIEEYCHERSPS
ncbi:transporter substrate-binding domain-containing protein [Vibrio sp. D404a]|uniref:ATP-binding protein n=1 Tax=unclassified Vibrio TaxID=2614977 RepID=UPI00255391F4|nr:MULTISPECIES: transporter substrate-binding domain-containing protein [unclassified Vibrio]MDK9738103.1 transporter substrate-binding domain-containing protein [Vibrio sp. D404a]MDK9796394.1 transporter substrate-binding domain-containing protein [Vibrio sp. D449a]